MLMSGKANRMQLVRGGLFRSSSGAISRLGSAMLLVAAVAGLNAPASAQYLTLHGIAWTTNAPVIQQTFTEVPVVSLSGIIAHDEIGNDGKANGALDTPAGQFTLSSHACSGGGPGFYGQAHGGAGASTYLDYLITSATLPAGAPVSVRVRWAVHASVMAVGQDMSGVNTVANGEADGYARIYINGNIVVNKTGSYSRSHGAYDGIQVIRSGTLNVEDDSDDQTYTVLIGQSLTVSMSGTASSASSIDAGQTDGDVQMAAVWGVTSLDPDASAVLQSNTSEPAPPAANATPAHVVEITPPRPPGLLPCFRIPTQPIAVATCSAAAATFSVAALGTGPFTYQWQIQISPESWATLGSDPLPLPCGGTAYASPYDAATTQIGVIGCPGGGSYQVQALITNPCGVISSNTVNLTFFPSGSGDGDVSGTIDGLDIQGLADILVSGGTPSAGYCAYDMNADGTVDMADVPLFISLLLI